MARKLSQLTTWVPKSELAPYGINNWDELERKLKAMKRAVHVGRLRDMLFDCAEMIRARAESNAKSMFNRLTGNLTKALEASKGKNAQRASAWARLRWYIAPHGHLLEFGHKIIGHKPGKKDTGKSTAPRPFFGTAVLSLLRPIRDDITRFIKKSLEEA